MADVYLTQPLQIVAGSQAGSKWMSDDLFKRAASTDKNFHVVEGSNHMELYDGKSMSKKPCQFSRPSSGTSSELGRPQRQSRRNKSEAI